jgi:hypothetical protein
LEIRNAIRHGAIYNATAWTGPVGTKLTNQSVNWEQRMSAFFVNGPMTLKNTNNCSTTKFETNKVAESHTDLSGYSIIVWLVSFDPIFWNFFRLFNFFPIVKRAWGTVISTLVPL